MKQKGNQTSLVRYSKFMSLVLRHKPEQYGLRMDSQSWVAIADLLRAAQCNGIPLTQNLLEEVVATNDKQRFALNEDKTAVRARQGHSISVDLGFTALQPPSILYHGTAQRFLSSILQKGLLRQNRQYVHLSAQLETARTVGARHGSPAVLALDTEAMVAQNYTFYRSENGVWLTDHVPSQFLSLLEERKIVE